MRPPCVPLSTDHSVVFADGVHQNTPHNPCQPLKIRTPLWPSKQMAGFCAEASYWLLSLSLTTSPRGGSSIWPVCMHRPLTGLHASASRGTENASINSPIESLSQGHPVPCKCLRNVMSHVLNNCTLAGRYYHMCFYVRFQTEDSPFLEDSLIYCGVYLYVLKLIVLNALHPKHCIFCASMFFLVYMFWYSWVYALISA